MKYRLLGKTNFTVSEIGLGTWPMGGGWGHRDDAQSVKTIKKCIDQGVTFIDTALAYGYGLSESLIKQALEQFQKRIYVATKIPPKNNKWPADLNSSLYDVFPPNWIMECTEKSLKNLGTDCIDLQQFHVWSDTWIPNDDLYDAMDKLHEAGKVKFFGISINDHAPETALKAVKSGKFAVVQVIYNIFDQTPEQDLFSLCQDMNVGVIVRVPFDEGALTGAFTYETKFTGKDWRKHYFTPARLKQVVERVEELKSLLNAGQNISDLALRFCLSHPAVSSVIPGMRSEQNVTKNCAASDGNLLGKELMAKLRHFAWPESFSPIN